MKTINFDENPEKSIGTTLWVLGLLLAVLGAAGIVLPGAMSFAIELFFGWLMITGGVLWGYYTYQFHAASLIDWVKPLILIVGGALLLIYPSSGVAAIALLVSFYLFIDAFGSFGMAYERHPFVGWGWLVANGVLSLGLALLILVGWPATSPIYLGIYVGISLLFDGLSLFMLGMAMKRA